MTRPMLGFKAFEAAQDPLVGIALMPMIKKRQLVGEEGNEGLPAAELFYSLAASSLHRQGPLPLHDLLSKICDTTGLKPCYQSTGMEYAENFGSCVTTVKPSWCAWAMRRRSKGSLWCRGKLSRA